MKLDDVRDLFAYLKTLPAAQDKSKPHELPFPFNIRRSLGVWKLLFLDGKPFEPDPAKDAAWNRGAYLVNGPGHCAECHSPRNFLGGIIASQRFAGGPEPTGDGFVPNITQKELGLTQEQLIKLLTTGETPDGDTVGGEMGKVVGNTAKLSDQDRAAIATYIKSLPPVEGPPKPKKTDKDDDKS
jgi:mono/diheme cytochrome c family protein